MNVKDYDRGKSSLNELKDIKGIFRNFDQTKDTISDFRLFFILPSGEYLLMPYTESDLARDVTYEHIDYFCEALECILKKLNINRDDFIENNIKEFNQNSIEFAILGLNVAIFNNWQNEDEKYMCFDKPNIFTERQKNSIAVLKRPFENEGYRFEITTFKDDNSIKDRNELKILIDDEFNTKSIYARHGDMDFNTICSLLNIVLEQVR